jgi:MOB kinase activator 1
MIISVRILPRVLVTVVFSGPKYEYHWADGQTVKKPIKCSAPKYIDYLMTWVQDQLDDESLFPSKIGKLDFN